MKTKLLLIILLGVLSSGCQIMERSQFPMDETHIDDELMPYYETFLKVREDLGFVEPLPHITIKLEVIDRTWRGVCYLDKELNDGNNYAIRREVIIDKDHYNNVMDRDGEGYHKGIEMLMFHELAHCFWEIEHANKIYPRTIKIYDHETAEDVYDEVMCRDLMHYAGRTYKGERDYLCYTQHYDLYLGQLRAIMKNNIYR